MALWCNTRGLGYAAGIFQNLKQAITRKGFAGIIETYTSLKTIEAAGHYVFWQGPGDHLLSLNLVPYIGGAADFGKGIPGYAQLLTRNVSGLGLYSSPDGQRLVVEACLPPDMGSRLISSLSELGLPVQTWHCNR